MIPQFLKDVINDFKLESVLNWLKEAIYFYVLPKRFFKNLYSKDRKEQVNQLIFYTILSIGLMLLLWDDTETKDGYKLIVSIIIISMLYFIQNALSLLIIDKKTFDLGKIFSFAYVVWVLISIPAFIFLRIFITSENYTFYFLANISNLVARLYCLFLIWHILFKSLKKILLGYVLNILILNISTIILNMFFIDFYYKDLTNDPIMTELLESTKEVKEFRGIPYSSVEESLETVAYKRHKLSFINNDTITYYNKEYVDLYKNLCKENCKQLDSIKQHLRFSRNKNTLEQLYKYFQNMSTYFDYSPCDTCLIKETVYKNKEDNSIVARKREYKIDEPYLKPYKNYELEVDRLIELSNKATSPEYVLYFLFKPLEFLVSYLGLEEHIKVFI